MSIDEFMAVLWRGSKYVHRTRQMYPINDVHTYRYDGRVAVHIGFRDTYSGEDFGITLTFPPDAFTEEVKGE